MAETLSLTSILNAIKAKLDSAIAVSDNQSQFTNNINDVEDLLKNLNSIILNKNEDYNFDTNEKHLMKNILDNISRLEKMNNNKLSFFDSLNKYFYDNVNK